MSAAAGSSAAGINSIISVRHDVNDLKEKLNQLENLVLACKQDKAITHFFLASIPGVMLLNMVSSLLLSWFQFAACKLNDTFGFTSALRKLIHRSTPDNVDIREGAMALASGLSTVSNLADVERHQIIEMGLRKKLSSFWEGLLGRGNTGHIDSNPIISRTGRGNTWHDQNLPTMVQSTAACGSQVSPLSMSIGVNLPGTTLKTAEEEERLRTQCAAMLPPGTQVDSVQGGSTFLSAIVPLSASAMDDLLQRAICLVKNMGATLFDRAKDK